jgi:hypothetical protein
MKRGKIGAGSGQHLFCCIGREEYLDITTKPLAAQRVACTAATRRHIFKAAIAIEHRQHGGAAFEELARAVHRVEPPPGPGSGFRRCVVHRG